MQNDVLIKVDSSWRKIDEVLAARHLQFLTEVLAARKRKLITARARKNKRTACMLAKTIRYPSFYDIVHLRDWSQISLALRRAMQ